MSGRTKFFISLAYWWVALSIVGLVGILHGDCFGDQQCYQNSRLIAVAGIGISGLGFVFLLRFLAKRSVKSLD